MNRLTAWDVRCGVGGLPCSYGCRLTVFPSSLIFWPNKQTCFFFFLSSFLHRSSTWAPSFWPTCVCPTSWRAKMKKWGPSGFSVVLQAGVSFLTIIVVVIIKRIIGRRIIIISNSSIVLKVFYINRFNYYYYYCKFFIKTYYYYYKIKNTAYSDLQCDKQITDWWISNVKITVAKSILKKEKKVISNKHIVKGKKKSILKGIK